MSSIVEHVVSSVGRLRLVPVLVLLAFGCACGAWLLPRWRRQRVTIYGASDKDMRRALTDGYRRGQTFGIPTPLGVHEFLHPRHIDEMNSYSDRELNLEAHFALHTLESVTKFSKAEHLFAQITRKGIMKHAKHVVSTLQREVILSADRLSSDKKVWSCYNAAEMMKHLIMSGCNIVAHGNTLGRHQQWLSGVEAYLDDAMYGFVDMLKYPQSLHEWLAPFNSRFKRLPPQMAQLKALLGPVIERYQQAQAAGAEPSLDGITWALEGAQSPEESELEFQVLGHLIMHYFNSIFIVPTAIILLFDLILRPDCMQVLRAEITSVCGEDWRDGTLSIAQLDRMVKLDSFIKESQRVATPTLYTMGRLAMKRVQLSDGTVLEPGTPFGIPLWPHTHDESLWVDAEQFDPFRHERLGKEQDASSVNHLMTAARPHWLLWGRGKHACPGRFFVVHVIKIAVIQLLMRYEMRFKDDARPRGEYFASGFTPDHEIQVEVRQR